VSGPADVSVKMLAAASLWLFHEDAELAWLSAMASQLRLAFGAMVASPSLWVMELIPEPGLQL
jgi:hypothetical protein